MKNGLLSGDSNPQPLRRESSALTTRPQLLAKKIECLKLILIAKEKYEKNLNLKDS